MAFGSNHFVYAGNGYIPCLHSSGQLDTRLGKLVSFLRMCKRILLRDAYYSHIVSVIFREEPHKES